MERSTVRRLFPLPNIFVTVFFGTNIIPWNHHYLACVKSRCQENTSSSTVSFQQMNSSYRPPQSPRMSQVLIVTLSIHVTKMHKFFSLMPRNITNWVDTDRIMLWDNTAVNTRPAKKALDLSFLTEMKILQKSTCSLKKNHLHKFSKSGLNNTNQLGMLLLAPFYIAFPWIIFTRSFPNCHSIFERWSLD